MKKSNIIFGVIAIVVIVIVIVVILVTNNHKESFEDYQNPTNDFIEQNEINSANRAENFQAAGLDIEKAYSENREILDSKSISFEGLTERDFYYDGYTWEIFILSKENIPYNISIDSNYKVYINEVAAAGQPSDI